MMKYYKLLETGDVFAYESEQHRHKHGAAELVEMTAGEVQVHLNTPLAPRSEDGVRAQRDALLSECDWVVIRAHELGEPVPQDWADYRQALRDVPEQAGFPEAVTWPAVPTLPISV